MGFKPSAGGYGEAMTESYRRDERISLAPLDPEEALRALLAVKPDDKLAEDDDQAKADADDR